MVLSQFSEKISICGVKTNKISPTKDFGRPKVSFKKRDGMFFQICLFLRASLVFEVKKSNNIYIKLRAYSCTEFEGEQKSHIFVHVHIPLILICVAFCFFFSPVVLFAPILRLDS